MPWAGKDLSKFAEEYNCKPVTLKGYPDYEKDIHI